MGSKHRTLAVLLSVVMSMPTGAAAADCSQVVEQIQSEARAFQAEADRQGLKAAMDASLDPALNLAKKGLVQVGGPQAETLEQLKDAKDKLQSFRERVGSLEAFLSALSACLHGGPPGCLSQLAGKVSLENLAYIRDLAGEDSAAAAQRVDKAASFVNDYASRLNGAAQGNAMSAVSCMDERIQQLAQSGQAPVDVPTQSTRGATAAPPDVKPRKRGGGGKVLAVTLGALAVGAGAVAVSKGVASSAASCEAGYVSCMSPGGGGAKVCCPAAAPYYCSSDNGCHASVSFSCPAGKVFCSTEY